MVLGTYTAKSTLDFAAATTFTPRLPYTTSSGHASYSNAVKNGHNTYNILQAPQQQQNFPPQHYNVQSFSPSHLAAVGPIPSVPLQNDCAVGKVPAVEIPKELVSLIQFFKTLV